MIAVFGVDMEVPMRIRKRISWHGTSDKCDSQYCEYYANEGVITDEQIHSWYKDEYGHFTEAEIKILDALEKVFYSIYYTILKIFHIILL